MHETDWVEDSGISEMSTLALNFAVTFSQPRVMNVTGSSGGCDKKGRAWTYCQWATVMQLQPIVTVRSTGPPASISSFQEKYII